MSIGKTEGPYVTQKKPLKATKARPRSAGCAKEGTQGEGASTARHLPVGTSDAGFPGSGIRTVLSTSPQAEEGLGFRV